MRRGFRTARTDRARPRRGATGGPKTRAFRVWVCVRVCVLREFVRDRSASSAEAWFGVAGGSAEPLGSRARVWPRVRAYSCTMRAPPFRPGPGAPRERSVRDLFSPLPHPHTRPRPHAAQREPPGARVARRRRGTAVRWPVWQVGRCRQRILTSVKCSFCTNIYI